MLIEWCGMARYAESGRYRQVTASEARVCSAEGKEAAREKLAPRRIDDVYANVRASRARSAASP